ncbi:hypothetical protein AGLY_014675 [Aphis glycines]|uniref:Uncharacterized protein n=1 Tax=Aphis glycines TaxID=307491 RepID=A0A6G0T2Q1_APHGL|nr:hypothetical protein AGLY_014675 [Aphis glycines]
MKYLQLAFENAIYSIHEMYLATLVYILGVSLSSQNFPNYHYNFHSSYRTAVFSPLNEPAHIMLSELCSQCAAVNIHLSLINQPPHLQSSPYSVVSPYPISAYTNTVMKFNNIAYNLGKYVFGYSCINSRCILVTTKFPKRCNSVLCIHSSEVFVPNNCLFHHQMNPHTSCYRVIYQIVILDYYLKNNFHCTVLLRKYPNPLLTNYY